MAQDDTLKIFGDGTMNQDDAVETIAPNDFISATNLRGSGSQPQQANYRTNIASSVLLSGSLLPGINSVIGGAEFDDTGEILMFRYNSNGNNQILLYNSVSNTYTVIYTDILDSAGVTLLPLDPANIVTAKLFNNIYAMWFANGVEVGYTNINTLKSGGYGTVLWEDLSLIKPQNPVPLNPVPNATSPDIITSGFGSDAGKPANDIYSHLAQFVAQGVNADFNYTAWGTRSKRFTPYQENTPILGVGVAQNNYIVVQVYIWSTRITTLNVAVQFDDSGQFYIIKSVDTAYIYALPNTGVDVSTEVYEAYDPVTNIYYFVFYNDTVRIPVNINETNLLYDYIYPSVAGAQLNGNIPGLGNWTIPYDRPIIPVTIAAVGYNPNIQIPANTYTDPLTAGASFPGASGSGAGDHRRNMWIILTGTPQTGDVVVIIDADIRSAVSTNNFSYRVPAAQSGNLLAVVTSIAETLSGSFAPVSGGYQIFWTDMPYYGLQTFSVELYFAGAGVANSIETVLDNAPYQISINIWDEKGRALPIATDNSYIVNMPSYAQQNGNASAINVTITNPNAPIPDGTYQISVTPPPVTRVLDTIACLINYISGWDARTNTPALTINSGNIGDTYQITTPSSPAAPDADYHNLGNNDTYNTGDYITNVGGTSGGSEAGQYYTVVPRTFGNLAEDQGGILVFSLNSLSLLNANFAAEGVSTNLVYDFAAGDRCTLQYFIPDSGGIGTFVVTPGSGYTDAVYTGVALTGGTGTGAVATITVAGGKVTNVLITTLGTGYVNGDTPITGTVAGGSGWFLTITELAVVYFNQPCIDLAVLGYDAGSYLVKVENSSALTFDSTHIYYNGQQIDARNIFMRLYSPAPQTGSASTALNTTVFREIGMQFPIVNGLFTQLNFTINAGGAYYLTRQFPDAIKPYTNPPVQVLATSLNYSDYYISPYYSFGRTRTYYDVLEASEQKALIITGQPYVIGSKINGLNRFYPINIYGNNNGQTSSSKGGIQIMEQRGQELVVFQELGIFPIPVNEAYTVVNDQLTGQSISSILLNNGRYDPQDVGIGLTKCFCRRYSTMYFVDPNKSLPYTYTTHATPISGKMSKFFMGVIQLAYSQGKQMIMYYNDYYEEVVFAIQAEGGQLLLFPFSLVNWNPLNNYSIIPADVSATPNGGNSTASYNSTTGVVTYTPTPGYVGSDTATFTFDPGTGSIMLNNCLAWEAGNSTVNAFSFISLDNQPLSTVVPSINNITVSGPDIAVAISIAGGSGEYSINGGSFTSAAGTVVAGDVIQVRLTSSGSNTTAVTTTLTIGATTGTFTVTTVGAGAGNYNVQTSYGITITSITDDTTTGTPSFGSDLPLSPGGNIFEIYTSITPGTVGLTYTGTPGIPGHTYFGLNQNGVQTDAQLITGSGNQTLTFTGTTNSPTPISIYVFTM